MTPTISTSTQKNIDTHVHFYSKRYLLTSQNELEFKPVTPEVMPLIWRYLIHENGRTCDFSYGGLLIWTPLFEYEYAIFRDTLFIKGKLEGDMSKPAFSLPLGSLSVGECHDILKRWCERNNQTLRFSAIPEYALADFKNLNPTSIKELPNWADYLYDITPMATLSGKKMAKKRNHVNKFESTFPNHEFRILTKELIPEVLSLLEKISSEADDQSDMAKSERQLCNKTLEMMQTYNLPMSGGVLYAEGRPVAFTVGDLKHDTLYIHIEKALRSVPGAYEAINKYFAEAMFEYCPSLKYINREDDAGSPGLKYAKESYHPIELLKKFDIIF
ncbi:MAG: phosphatidylglycerol lysyltransferase domain-containing protein [Prevotella sp.]|nr:phosphatidylglycerol lysyltransferase domain-containing protein [Prevotella sp.]MCM1074688.1 phosphatidylglycerol lysyltransferase domain-containing protein [Ruminococcus sp.]